METVEKRLIVGERLGSAKFSDKFPDKNERDQTDHLACLLLSLRVCNTKAVNGLFLGKALPESTMNMMLWGLIKMEEYKIAPSKQKKPSNVLTPTGAPSGDDETAEDNNEQPKDVETERIVDAETEQPPAIPATEGISLHNALVKVRVSIR